MNVNAHIHTPYSFSAFDSIAQVLDAAVAEGIGVVGINDFDTTDGFAEWDEGCRARRLYPLFNIEMRGLDEELQRAGVRVNDPANPGRVYLSGKGLAFPARTSETWESRMVAVRAESVMRIRAMCEKLNGLMAGVDIPALDFDEIVRTLTLGLPGERHLAKALRLAVYKEGNLLRAQALLEKLFGGKTLSSSLDDVAGVENEIRAALLKAGGAAFVAETPAAFLPVEMVVLMIEEAGGIPTYPFLADDAEGRFTEFEADLPEAADALRAMGIHSVEFITARNSAAFLEHYAGWLWDEGFAVTFGSEHNTPAREPLVLTTRGGEPLTPRLKELNYLGACVVAGHQALYAHHAERYHPEFRDHYAALGHKVIKHCTDG